MVRVQSGLLAFLLVSILISCGKETASSPPNPEADEKFLALRLQKSEAVRAHVTGLRHALRRLDALLGDIAKALGTNNTIEGKPIDKAQTYFTLLQKLLKQSTEGLVKIDKDGSWSLDRSVSGLEAFLHCPKVTTHIVGQAKNGVEELKVSLRGCDAEAAYHELLHIRIEGDVLDVTLTPNAFSELTKEPLKADKCEVKIEKKRTEIHCRPIEIEHQGWKALLSPIDMIEEVAGLTANVRGQLWNPSGKEAALVEFEQKPGQQPRVNVTIR